MQCDLSLIADIITIVSTPCFELSDDDFESESNELELACFDAELYSIIISTMPKIQNEYFYNLFATQRKRKQINDDNRSRIGVNQFILSVIPFSVEFVDNNKWLRC